MRFYALAQRPWIEDDGGYWGLPPGTIGSVDLSAVGAHDRVFVTSDQPFAGDDIIETFGDGADHLGALVLSGRLRSAWQSFTGVLVPDGATLLDALLLTLGPDADPFGDTRAKPIMPTHRGVLKLWLGGHSLIRSEQLPEDPTLHPAWPVMQRVLRNEYRAIQSRDETLARMWLRAQQIKLRVSEERVGELLIDDDLRLVEPLEPTTTIFDDFNRADESPLGTSSQGTWSWVGVAGTWAVVSNAAQTTGGVTRAGVEFPSADHYAEVEYANEVSIARGAICRKDSSATLTYYYADNTGAAWRTFRRVDGTHTSIGSNTSGAASVGDVVKIEADGSTISRFVNGSLQNATTDTNIPGNGFCGMWSGSSSRLDNFEAADLLAEPPGDPVFLRPVSTDTIGGWRTETGGTDLHDSINEVEVDDDDFIRSEDDPALDVCKVKLGSGAVDASEDVTVRYRYRKQGTGAIDLRVRLLEGTTERALWTHTDISDSFLTASQTLTTEQAESVTDWSDVFLEFRADKP